MRIGRGLMKKNINIESQKQAEEKLRRLSKISKEELFAELKSSINGLSIVDIDDLLDDYGKNIIDFEENHTLFHKIKEAIINPFNIVLLVVAIITFITDVVIATEKDYATFLLIIGTVIISAIISLVQETKSDNAAKQLKSLITNKIDVIRDEVPYEVSVEDIVPGDIVKLSSGDMIPGDVRFLEVKDLFIDQASLTGESNPVEKFTVIKNDETITDISNIGFMGTNVVSRFCNSNCFSNWCRNIFWKYGKITPRYQRKK